MNSYIKNSFRLVLGTLVGAVLGLIVAIAGGFIILFFLSSGSQGGVFAAIALCFALPQLMIPVLAIFSLIFLLRTRSKIGKDLRSPENVHLRRVNNLVSLFLIIAIVISGSIFFDKLSLSSRLARPPKKVSLESCNKIKDLHYQGLCFLRYIEFMKSKDLLAMSKEERDGLVTNICGKITEDWMEDDCIENLALKSGDSVMCGKISYEYDRNMCEARVAKKLSDCEKFDYRFKKACYQSVAKAKKDISICDEKIPRMKDTCRGVVYSAIAAEKKDKTICDKIPPRTALRDSCYADVAIASNDRSACDGITMLIHKSRCIRKTSGK